MTHLCNTVLTIALLSGAGASLPVWADESGTAKLVQGAVRVERDGASMPLRVGDRLLEKDRVVVPAGGAAGITLRDDTRISLGSGATLVLNQFKFDPQTQEGNVDTSIFSGAMRYITGLVGRHRRESVRVSTATTTLGIRGTDFIVEVGDGP
ncbi:MAG: FecR domain-containing protein [Betaproteobacteria bacterium]